jgi:hypothetical protein
LAPDFVEREELPPGIPRDREGVKHVDVAKGADFAASVQKADYAPTWLHGVI